jgi:hypothetical protein
MNAFENIPAESEFRDAMTVIPQEMGREADLILGEVELAIDQDTPLGELLDDQGWPGDGSGTDDLADYNANEAADYGQE